MRKLIVTLCLATFGLCLWAVDADAGCFNRRRVVVREEVVAVVTPVVATVAVVPALSYQYVPAAAPISVAPATSPGLSDADVERIARRLQQGYQQPAQQNLPGAPPAVVPQSASNGAVGVLQQRCAQCHSGAQAKSGVQIFDAAGNLTPMDKRTRSWLVLQADAGLMPKGVNGNLKSPAAVPDNELALLKQWAVE